MLEEKNRSILHYVRCMSTKLLEWDLIFNYACILQKLDAIEKKVVLLAKKLRNFKSTLSYKVIIINHEIITMHHTHTNKI